MALLNLKLLLLVFPVINFLKSNYIYICIILCIIILYMCVYIYHTHIILYMCVIDM